MALTLRELLEKQRADREAKELGATQVVQAVLKPQQVLPPGHAATAPSTPPKKSLFARVSGTGNGASQPPEAPSGQLTATVPAAKQEITPPAGLPTPLPSLPQYSEDETENFRKNLAFLAANLDEKEVIGQILRTTVRQIQQHPELSAITIDSDYDLIIAAARRSTKFVARKKEDKADAKTKKQSQKDELTQWLKDSGINLDEL